jgi:hypothetical protein
MKEQFHHLLMYQPNAHFSITLAVNNNLPPPPLLASKSATISKEMGTGCLLSYVQQQ